MKNINVCDDKFVTIHGEDGTLGFSCLEEVVEVVSLERSEASCSFWNNLRRRESILRQKSRIRWCLEGDLNTRFFHNSLKERNRRNFLGCVATSSGTVQDVAGVKDEVKRFLKGNILSPLSSDLSWTNSSFLDYPTSKLKGWNNHSRRKKFGRWSETLMVTNARGLTSTFLISYVNLGSFFLLKFVVLCLNFMRRPISQKQCQLPLSLWFLRSIARNY